MRKVHFELTKPVYEQRVQSGAYKTQWGPLWYRDIPPDYDTFWSYLKRVGHKWGWDKMTDRFSQVAMDRKLHHPETKLRELMEDDQVIGYTLIVSPDQKLKDRFWGAAAHDKVIEIENLGLFPENCGGGRGWSFFEMQFADLFKTYDTVYWSMSSTNHPTLMKYYQRMGMNVLGQDRVPNYSQPNAAVA